MSAMTGIGGMGGMGGGAMGGGQMSIPNKVTDGSCKLFIAKMAPGTDSSASQPHRQRANPAQPAR